MSAELRLLSFPITGGQIKLTLPKEVSESDFNTIMEVLRTMEKWIVVPQKAGATPKASAKESEVAPHHATRSDMRDEAANVGQSLARSQTNRTPTP
jgi:hypothetical protein